MRGLIWLTIAILLLFAWVGSFIVYHVAGFLIHLLLIFALIALVIQLFTENALPRRIVRHGSGALTKYRRRSTHRRLSYK